MPVISGVVNHKKMQAALARAERKLGPDVERIRYSIDEDWTGDRSVFFNVVLSDEASIESRLRESAQRTERVVLKEVDPSQYGLRDYFAYRSASEQAGLKEKSWA